MKPKIQPTTPMINPCNACIHSNGMTVMCDLPHNRCTVQVSGWYYGKTAGLLGTYDNEPYTDMLTADNSIAADMAQLADGWTVGQRCQVVNRARQVDAAPDNRRYRLCAEYFADAASPFRPCRMLVDPKPFFTMCLNDMKINVNRIETSEDVCDVASMYVNECRRQGVPIALPAFCSKWHLFPFVVDVMMFCLFSNYLKIILKLFNNSF